MRNCTNFTTYFKVTSKVILTVKHLFSFLCVRSSFGDSKCVTLEFISQFYVHSQHRYQPRLYISRVDKQSKLQPTSTFAFDETSFITVTTYQNKQVCFYFQ